MNRRKEKEKNLGQNLYQEQNPWPKIYVLTRSSHNINELQLPGEVVYLAETAINRFATNKIYRHFRHVLERSSSSDYILLSGLTVMAIVAAGIFAAKHNRLNLLIYNPKTETYIARTLDLGDD